MKISEMGNKAAIWLIMPKIKKMLQMNEIDSVNASLNYDTRILKLTGKKEIIADHKRENIERTGSVEIDPGDDDVFSGIYIKKIKEQFPGAEIKAIEINIDLINRNIQATVFYIQENQKKKTTFSNNL